MDKVEDTLRHKLYSSKEQEELYEIAKMAQLIKQLYSMEVTNGECAYVEENKNRINSTMCAQFIKNITQKNEVEILSGYDLGMIFGDIDDAIVFYKDAEARNQDMLRNTISVMKRNGKNVAALITGGYHTKGLTSLMKKNKLSYLVVVPKFESGSERPYIAILTNKTSAYEKILETGKYQIAVEAYFSATSGDLSRLKSSRSTRRSSL